MQTPTHWHFTTNIKMPMKQNTQFSEKKTSTNHHHLTMTSATPDIILCKLIYPGYITFYTCCNCIPQDKVDSTYRAFDCRCSLHQCDAVSRWRRLTGTRTEFLRLAHSLESSVSAVKLYPEEYSCNMYRIYQIFYAMLTKLWRVLKYMDIWTRNYICIHIELSVHITFTPYMYL